MKVEDLMMLGLGSGLIVVWLVLMAIAITLWVLNCLFVMKFCANCGHAHAGLVWLPVPGVANVVILQSMVLSGAVGYSNALIWITTIGMVGGLVLSFIPLVGLLFVVISVVCGVIQYVLMVAGVYKVANLVNKSGIVYLLLYMFVSILQPFLWRGLANGLLAYADAEYT